jgi:hypothetical protein
MTETYSLSLAARICFNSTSYRMKNNPRIERLREMMNLEERRVALQQQLDDVVQHMTELKDALFAESGEPEPISSRERVKASTVSSSRTKAPTQRGALKDRIMAALEAAGARGVRVKELALALGTKPVNVHSWFHSSIKRYPAIKKLQGGHYRLEGSVSEKRSTPSRGSAKTAPAAPAKAGRKKTASRGKRGELTSKILGALENAGSKGIAVKDLADQLGANYRNIYIWFATTGKKNPSVKKVGPAFYRLAS